MTFKGVLELIGKGFEKGLHWAVEYGVPVEKLVGTLFPGVAPATTVLEDATTLMQNAVLLVEQKFTAAGQQNGTGAQKLAEVMLLAGPAVTHLLDQAGITTSSSYLESLVSAVVAILNVQTMPTTSAPAAITA